MDTNTSHILPFKNSITVLLHIMALDCIREYVNEKSVCINSIDLCTFLIQIVKSLELLMEVKGGLTAHFCRVG